MNPTDKKLAELARMVAATGNNEIDCAEFLERVAPYLHALTENAEMDAYLRDVTRHLRICPECHEQFIALLKAEGLDEDVLPRH